MQLCIRNLYKHFDKKIVLNHTGFVFQEGSIYSVLGRNGAGKTTLFGCISGDLFFEDGEVFLEENGVSRPLTFEDVCVVSASPVLPDFLTGYEFIHFFVKLNRENPQAESIDSFFDLVRLDEEDRHPPAGSRSRRTRSPCSICPYRPPYRCRRFRTSA